MFFRAFPWRLFCIYVKFELLSPEIYSILENKDILIRFKVYGKSAISAQTVRDSRSKHSEIPNFVYLYFCMKIGYLN